MAENLRARLLSHQKAFNELLQKIPTKHYLGGNGDEEQENSHNYNSKYSKHTKKQISKSNKLKKLDPENDNSVVHIQESKAAADTANVDSTVVVESNNSSTDDVVMESSNNDKKIVPMKSATVSELREKLAARIAELRAGRNAIPSGTLPLDLSSGNTPLPKSRQDILEQRKKKKESRKSNKQQNNNTKSSGNNEKGEGNNSLAKPVKRKEPTSDNMNEVKDEVNFGILSFGDGKKVEDASTGHVRKKRKGPTDTRSQLIQVKAKAEKLSKLKESNPEKASAIQESEKWSNLLAKAQGEKVKDDPKLLEKTLKREKKLKEKKVKVWKERSNTVQENMLQKQKKREANIQARKDAKKEKKSGKKSSGGKTKSKKKAK